MENVIKVGVVVALILGIMFGIIFLQGYFTMKHIKGNAEELAEIPGFTMEIYTDLTEVDNDTSDMDVEPSIIYSEYGDVRTVKQEGNFNIIYGGVTYVVNDVQNYYYTVDNATNFPDYDLTNILPKNIDINQSAWVLSKELEVESTTFKGTKCNAVIFVEGNDTYTTYLRKDDGVCIGKCEEINGEKKYEYYVVETEEINESDFEFEALLGKYDKVIITAFERPYVQRDNGMKEYIDM